MSIFSALRVALNALMVNKGRSALTSLGIVIGISAVICLVSAGDGARLMLDERLDNITAKYMDDPEAFWRIADANAAMRPEELTETIGRRLRITLPEGIPGNQNA